MTFNSEWAFDSVSHKKKETVLDLDWGIKLVEPVTGSEFFYGSDGAQYLLFFNRSNPLFKYISESPSRITEIILQSQPTRNLIKPGYDFITVDFGDVTVEGTTLILTDIWPTKETPLTACEKIEQFRDNLEKWKRGKAKKKKSKKSKTRI